MAKTFKIKPIVGIERKPLTIPVFDGEGNPSLENNKPKMRDFTLIDVSNILIRNLPRERMTMENITHGTRLRSQILDAKNSTLIIEEAEHDWVVKMLKDDTVGAKIFGMDLLGIIDALDKFERLHEPQEEGKK